LFQPDVVSGYLALIMNLIWFADKKKFIVSALSDNGHEIGCLTSQ